MDDDKRLDKIDERMDRYEKNFNAEVKESAEFRGEMRQFMPSMKEFIQAVNLKAGAARTALDDHEKDPDAHGAGVKRDLSTRTIGWATVIGGLIGGALASIGGFIHTPGSK